MKSVLAILLIFSVLLLGSCMMPNPKEQIAANEVKLAAEGYEQLEVGAEAPAIEGQDQNGNAFSLAEALQDGPVVLYFYPANRTPNCTNQLKQLSRLQDELSEAGMGRIYGLNPAPASETAAYLEKEGIKLTVIEDAGLRISEQYGCASTTGTTQMQERTVVGISQDGKVAFYQRRYFLKAPSVKLLQGAEYFNLGSS